MSQITKYAALVGLLTFMGTTAQAAEIANGSNLNGANLNGSNLNGANLNGSNLNGSQLNGSQLNGMASGRVFLGTYVLAVIAPDGTLVTLD
jgi:uncharacterized protein YjbI with pentapeptide repeats